MPIVSAVAVPHPPIILPAVGRGEESRIQATIDAYRLAMQFVAHSEPETIIITSPHATLYTDSFHLSPGAASRGDFSGFGAPQVRIRAEYDTPLTKAIEQQAGRMDIPAGRAGERRPELDHGTLIPLYFLNEYYKKYKIVRIGLSGFSFAAHYRFGECIEQAVQSSGKRVAFVASGDLSHKLKTDGPYDFAPEGPVLDAVITEALASADFGRLLAIPPALAEKGAECGLRSFLIMAGALNGRAVQAELLSYEGPFGVGYAVATFAPGKPDPGRCFAGASKQPQSAFSIPPGKDAYVALARYALENYIKKGVEAVLPAAGLPGEMLQNKAGVFVSLHRGGELRGCIGTIAPATGSIAGEIMQNAVSAAVGDPRFPPLSPEELEGLEISVDVLGSPESISGEEELSPRRYGVIVSRGHKRGLLLPDLDGIDTPHQQVEIARRKAGIRQGEPLVLERFEVIRHTEE